MEVINFLQRIADKRLNVVDRAVALVWYFTEISGGNEASISEIAEVMESAGFGLQNRTRLRTGLQKDKRVTKSGVNSFRVHPRYSAQIREGFKDFLAVRPLPVVDTVLPLELFGNARGYIRKVVLQVNAAYEYSLFDCCAVMMRRLLETLIIEVFEHCGRENELKGSDGNYKMFSGLLSQVEQDRTLDLSRNARKGLADFKRLGDLSAHNRKFNATQDDIDRIRDGARVAVEELLYACGQGPVSTKPA